jgi:hypothetical protein
LPVSRGHDIIIKKAIATKDKKKIQSSNSYTVLLRRESADVNGKTAWKL